MSSPRPAAALRARAALLAAIRAFFVARDCCEVTTSVLVPHAASEAALASFRVATPDGGPVGYLRTSPESAMKQLVAAGSGDIYQLGPVCRAGEAGRRHAPEFTLLEWYRVGLDHHGLMDEVEALVRALGCARPVARVPYGELFAAHVGLDPHRAPDAELARCAQAHGLALAAADVQDRALLLDALYALVVEPALAGAGVIFVHDYPRALRAYARLSGTEPAIAARFELSIDGLEIANGYHEITDMTEQAACFAADNALRARRGLPRIAVDEAWLTALTRGLPDCAGVALGVERLHMALTGAAHIEAVASPLQRPGCSGCE